MHGGFFSLLRDQRFLPLFLTQFLGAFTDNLFRSALLILVTFDVGMLQGYNGQLLTPLIGGLVILPFFIFSSLAGQLADKFEKARLVQVIKGVEILTISLSIYGFYTQSMGLLLFTLFLAMTHTAFFGPLKYSLIPTYLKSDEIVTANALVESSTFISILLGTIMGGILISIPQYGVALLSALMLISTISGWVSSLYFISAKPSEPKLKINWNLYKETIAIVKYASKDRVLFLAIIGISWFWVVGSVMLTQISAYGKEIIGGNEQVAILFMFLFAIGIGLGSFLCNRWMRGHIDARLVPWGAIGTTIFIIDFVIASHLVNLVEPTYIGVKQFLRYGNNIRICFDLLMIAVGAGICMVPLYAMVQTQADPKHCSRVIAANNVVNAFFMVISSLATLALIALDVTILNIFLIVGLLNLFAMYRLSVLVPESILQLVLQALMKLLFRIEVKGMENFHKAGDRVLIIANHTSLIDAALLFAFIPERLNYAIYTYYVSKWWIRLITSGINLFPIDPTHPMATKKLIDLIRKGKKCVIFPEGRITVTGALMKIFDGPGMIADRSDAMILPIRIEGAQYSLFSRLKGKVSRKLCPKITVTILPPRKVEASPEVKGRARRRIISQQMYDLMVGMLFETSPYHTTLVDSLIDAAKQHGMGREIVEDTQRTPLTYRQMLMRCFILGRWLKLRTDEKEHVGILLPTSVANLVTFFGLQFYGRIPAMLNFSLGAKTLIETCQLARIRLVVTSHRFVEVARLAEVMEQLADHVKIIYLEDAKEDLGMIPKLRGFIETFVPYMALQKYQKNVSINDPAVILFTSGSEGSPKGVVLSHVNLNANRYQITCLIDLNSQDVVLNVLPMFHSFGLTGGTLIPVLQGIRVFLYPSPLHYRTIPVIAYDIDATIFFATDTFLYRYGMAAHPYDFYSTRFVVAGAEKLRAETRKLWMEKFGIQVHEGYGATEASPGVCINTRIQSKVGTVGRLLPSIEHRLKSVPGIEQGGRLQIKGPNIMLGYLSPETGQIIEPQASVHETGKPEPGWYDTGDIVDIDDQGFVTILGRAKRFAKIAGEMVSLTLVEEKLQQLYPEISLVVLAIPDDRKGEQLVVLSTSLLAREEITKYFKAAGLAELMLPRRMFQVDHIPMLPTGKTDLKAANELLRILLEEEAQPLKQTLQVS
jgi:acyl-[acyl-carrier-protein]-phospholipid O-acyltransferase / long-chain-fatty-acid--[acyl-carrier-protein] ligase